MNYHPFHEDIPSFHGGQLYQSSCTSDSMQDYPFAAMKQQPCHAYHSLTQLPISWQQNYAYQQPQEEMLCVEGQSEFQIQQQELIFQVHNQQQEMLALQEQYQKELEEQRRHYEEVLETQKRHMWTQAKEQFDARWKQYEEVIIGQQQSQAALASNLATLNQGYEENLIKVSAAIAVKEEDFQRTLAAHDEFHDKELQEYKLTIEFLISKATDVKEAHQIQLEEALCKERKETISELSDGSHNVAKQTIELEVDLFKELPSFVEEDNTSNMSLISVAEGQSKERLPKKKPAAKNVDMQNEESILEENQFWDDLESFCSELDSKSATTSITVLDQLKDSSATKHCPRVVI